MHATLAKANLDIDRTTPGSDTVSGGALDIAASTGLELAYLAGTNLAAFTTTVQNYPVAYAAAIAEISTGAVFSLTQLWSAQRTDHVLCGSQACQQTNNDYQTMWIEGYQPLPGTPGAIPLNDYWSVTLQDNWTTTSSTAPSGYTPAIFSDGYVLATQQPGTVPLQLYYSAANADHMTVASQQGIQYAQANGYQLVTAVLGYVYSSPPSTGGAIPAFRQAYSLALLESGMN